MPFRRHTSLTDSPLGSGSDRSSNVRSTKLTTFKATLTLPSLDGKQAR